MHCQCFLGHPYSRHTPEFIQTDLKVYIITTYSSENNLSTSTTIEGLVSFKLCKNLPIYSKAYFSRTKTWSQATPCVTQLTVSTVGQFQTIKITPNSCFTQKIKGLICNSHTGGRIWRNLTSVPFVKSRSSFLRICPRFSGFGRLPRASSVNSAFSVFSTLWPNCRRPWWRRQELLP